jgi:uncharacterized protein (DUF433 family)
VELDRDMLNLFRKGRAYTAPRAAVLAGAQPQTVRRWIDELESKTGRMAPVLPVEEGSGRGARKVSFLDLAEIAVIARFRRGTYGQPGVPLHRLWIAREYARRELNVDYPFASLALRQFGQNVLYEFERKHPGPTLIALDMYGQHVFPSVVESVLDSFTYDDYDRLAYIWHPLGKDVPIVINPLIAAGQPVIEGTGARVESIQARIQAGDSRTLVADDYGISQSDVDHALKFAA